MAKTKTVRTKAAATPESVGRKVAKLLGKFSKTDRKAALKFANGVLRLADSINK